MSFFDKIKAGMSKTRTKLNNVFANFRRVDEDLMEELEEALILCDMGVTTTETVMEELTERVKLKNIKDAEEVKSKVEVRFMNLIPLCINTDNLSQVILVTKKCFETS